MKNVIRGAALLISGMIGFSAYLIKNDIIGNSFEEIVMMFCGIMAIIGIICMIIEPITEAFRSYKEENEENNTQ